MIQEVSLHRVLGTKTGKYVYNAKFTIFSSVTSNKVEDDLRTVVMTRDLTGKTSDHYTFDPSASSIPIISASGLGSAFAYHGPKLRSGGTLKLSAIDVPTCVCDEGIKGSINGVPFNKNCLDEPEGIVN